MFDLNSVDELPVYVDGADEITRHLHMIKGGGGALTGEKIVAAVARKFVCIADAEQAEGCAGQVSAAGRGDPDGAQPRRRASWSKLGGQPKLREGFTTDNGNMILDVHGLTILESGGAGGRRINQIAGVVTNGLFARRPADVLLLGTAEGVQTLTPACRARTATAVSTSPLNCHSAG